MQRGVEIFGDFSRASRKQMKLKRFLRKIVIDGYSDTAKKALDGTWPLVIPD
jgi:hypothetical protein